MGIRVSGDIFGKGMNLIPRRRTISSRGVRIKEERLYLRVLVIDEYFLRRVAVSVSKGVFLSSFRCCLNGGFRFQGCGKLYGFRKRGWRKRSSCTGAILMAVGVAGRTVAAGCLC